MAALLSCTSLCVFCCISRNFVFRGRFVILLMDHGTMSRLMFGLIKAARQDEEEDEADVCALCCHKRSTITGCGEC